jgi:hypothetical protein
LFRISTSAAIGVQSATDRAQARTCRSSRGVGAIGARDSARAGCTASTSVERARATTISLVRGARASPVATGEPAWAEYRDRVQRGIVSST